MNIYICMYVNVYIYISTYAAGSILCWPSDDNARLISHVVFYTKRGSVGRLHITARSLIPRRKNRPEGSFVTLRSGNIRQKSGEGYSQDACRLTYMSTKIGSQQKQSRGKFRREDQYFELTRRKNRPKGNFVPLRLGKY